MCRFMLGMCYVMFMFGFRLMQQFMLCRFMCRVR